MSEPQPKGYVLVEIEVHDHDYYRAEYMSRSTPAVEAFGGRFLVRGGDPQVLEGDRTPSRIVICEFPSPEQALAFYHSEQYQAAAKHRHRSASAHYYVLRGVSEP